MQAYSQQRVWSGGSRDRHGWSTLPSLPEPPPARSPRPLWLFAEFKEGTDYQEETRIKLGMPWDLIPYKSTAPDRLHPGVLRELGCEATLPLWRVMQKGQKDPDKWKEVDPIFRTATEAYSWDFFLCNSYSSKSQLALLFAVSCSTSPAKTDTNWKDPQRTTGSYPQKLYPLSHRHKGKKPTMEQIRKKEIPCIIRFICLKPSGNWLFRI